MEPSESLPTPYPAITTSIFFPYVPATVPNAKLTSLLLSNKIGTANEAVGTCAPRMHI